MAVFDTAIESGDLRHRVQVQQATETRDAYGQAAKSWSTVLTMWAKVTPLSGRELFVAQQRHALTDHAVELRYNPDIRIDPTWRLLYGTRVLNMLSVLDVNERHIKTVVLCQELLAPPKAS